MSKRKDDVGVQARRVGSKVALMRGAQLKTEVGQIEYGPSQREVRQKRRTA